MRYRAGWLIKDRILALTHFDPVVTPEDFKNIAADTQRALHEVTQAFHILIDNRNIAGSTVVPLDMMLQAMPIIRHPQLRWIVVVLPEAIKENAASMPVQRSGSIRLRAVDCLDTAFQQLVEVDSSIDRSLINHSFFIPD